ncbi:MAG: hypothetical protein D6769_01255 [Methanobacteriota archaeon]|nr:MAG: hypothetical protein D6769_01255 [Euryarchaeota archaeon]
MAIVDMIPWEIPGGDLVIAIALFVISGIILEAIATFIILSIRKITERTANELDDDILDFIVKKKHLLLLLLSAFVAVELVYGNINVFGTSVYDWFFILFIVVGGIFVIDFFDVIVDYYLRHIAPKTKTGFDEEILPLARNLVKIGLYAILLTVVLSQLGVDIGPIIAGLGIGGLAIGLALQDTLANFFAGLHIIADRPIRVGDYIKVGSVEGTVQEIGWRTTKLLALGNKVIVLPNKELANSTLVNYFKPGEPTGHVVTFGVGYGSDVEEVKKIFLKVCKKMAKEGLITKDEPWVRLDAMGDSSLDFKGGFVVPVYTARFAAQGRFYELMYDALNKAGIDIPFPTRTVYLKEEKSGRSRKKR